MLSAALPNLALLLRRYAINKDLWDGPEGGGWYGVARVLRDWDGAEEEALARGGFKELLGYTTVVRCTVRESVGAHTSTVRILSTKPNVRPLRVSNSEDN